MVSNTEDITKNIPITVATSDTIKKTSVRKSLCQLIDLFDVKQKTL